MFPTLFQIGPFAFRTYTVLVAGGLAFALGWLWYRAPAEKRLVWWDAGLWAMVGGFVGARLLYAIVNNTYYFSRPIEILSVWEGGLAWPGAVAGALIGLLAYCRRQGEPAGPLLDELALPIVILAGLSWGGCIAAGCAYGFEITPGRWPAWFTLSTPDLYGVVAPRFPTQVLGLAWSVLTVLGIWYASRQWQAGARGALAIGLVALGAMFLSLTRGDPIPAINQIRLDVIGSGVVLVIALIAFFSRLRARALPAPAPAQPMT